MSRRVNARRRLLTSWWLAALLAGPAGAAAPLPDADDARAACERLRLWVDAFDDLPHPGEPSARLPVTGASGVCITLRRNGRIVGVGSDDRGDALMARRAVGRALSEVLGQRAVADLPEVLRAGVGRQLALEVEFAGPPVPLLGRSPAELAEQVEPGLDGVAVRYREAVERLYPSQMLAINMAGHADRMLPAMARRLGLRVDDETNWTQPDLTVYRFRTIHLTQRPDRAPAALFRGDQLVAVELVTPERVGALADGIARHLLRSRWPEPPPGAADERARREPLGVMGTYRPIGDRYEPLVAPPLDQALVVLALRRYAAAPGVDGAVAREAAAAADLLLRDLADVTSGEPDPLDDPAACAALVYAMIDDRHDRERDASLEALLRSAIAVVLASHDPAAGFDARLAAPHARAVVAGAIGRLHRTGAAPAGAARSAADAAWASTPPHRQVALLPWIAWAEADLAAASNGPLAHAERLVTLRDMLDRSRIGPANPGTADLVGGFDLSRHPTARASAQSSRVAIFMAWAAARPALTPADQVDAATAGLMRTMRFLIQLSVRDGTESAWPNPARALGGIRAAPWDADQPVPAQAMGLLAAVETLLTLQTAGRLVDRPL